MLVSVLMLSTMLLSCAMAFTWFVRTQARSAMGERAGITARSMAYVLTGAVMAQASLLGEHTGYDSLTQRWYQPFVLPIDGVGTWIVRLTPLDDKIPLRSLFLPDGSTMRRELTGIWEDLWEKLGHRELENVITDFLDKNKRARVGGAEEDYFINRTPYDIAELLLISGDVTPELLDELGDYCTIYSDGRINLNVAPVQVMELLPGLDTGGMAQRVAQARTEKPLETLRDVQSLPGAGPKISSQLTNIAAFKSRYIRIDISSLAEEGGKSFSIIIDRTAKQIVKWEEI